MTVRFFHRDLPVFCDAQSIALADGTFQWWTVVCDRLGHRGNVTLRTSGGRSIQERLDNFVRKESGHFGYDLMFADRIRPATYEEIKGWFTSHKWLYRDDKTLRAN